MISVLMLELIYRRVYRCCIQCGLLPVSDGERSKAGADLSLAGSTDAVQPHGEDSGAGGHSGRAEEEHEHGRQLATAGNTAR